MWVDNVFSCLHVPLSAFKCLKPETAFLIMSEKFKYQGHGVKMNVSVMEIELLKNNFTHVLTIMDVKQVKVIQG